MSAYTKIFLRPGENELIETDITLKPDARSAVFGVVRDEQGRPIEQATVLLFEMHADERLTPLTQAFTDDTGQFIFGHLTAGRLYVIQVFKNAVKLRELEITVSDND